MKHGPHMKLALQLIGAAGGGVCSMCKLSARHRLRLPSWLFMLRLLMYRGWLQQCPLLLLGCSSDGLGSSSTSLASLKM